MDCLDEFEEEYSIACSECTGEGSVHSRGDLVSANHVKVGSENQAAYDLAKGNYHRYLVHFLLWHVKHQTLRLELEPKWADELDRRGIVEDDLDVLRDVVARDGYAMWAGPEKVLGRLMDKTLAELKCRQDKTHDPQDRLGRWERNETHLSEHRPYLNNVSTALKRGIAVATLEDMANTLSMIFDPFEADDVDDEGNSEQYNSQTFLDHVILYNLYMQSLSGSRLPAPTKPGTPGLPYDVLEFVPMFATTNFNSRLDRLRMDLLSEKTRAEAEAPTGDVSLRGDRSRDEYYRNEHFVDRTLAFILELLALDPGLTRVRMLETAKLFHSVLMEPWYEQHGHAGRSSLELPQGHEAENLALRDAVVGLDNAAAAVNRQRLERNFTDHWWPELCYREVTEDRSAPGPGPRTAGQVHGAALNRWRRFYANWLQILANVELTHTRLTQEQLDAESTKSCPVCADDYVVADPHNCAVWIGCGNQHTLCKKCYTQLSLTPTRPYNDLATTKYCPQCRSELRYEVDLRSLTEGLRLMPGLNTDFPYNTIVE